MHNEELTAKSCFLAGALGFEPRQSAPKALDLPLVDGPASLKLTIFGCRLSNACSNGQPTAGDRQSKIFRQYSLRPSDLVTRAANPDRARRLTATLAATLDRNKPYIADPDPDSEA